MRAMRHVSCCLRGFGCLVVSLAIAAGPALAAQASLRGTVRDESGAVLPGANVTVRNVEGGLTRTVTTDARGGYEVSIEAGRYEIAAELPGFRARPEQLSMADDESRTVDLTLQVAPLSLSEKVTVTRGDQERTVIPNAVSVVEAERIQIGERRVSPAEALGDIPGLFARTATTTRFRAASVSRSAPRSRRPACAASRSSRTGFR